MARKSFIPLFMYLFLRQPAVVVAIFLLLAGHAASAQSLADALDNELVWTTGGDAAWLVQTNETHDGIDAVRSGIVVSNQTSWIETAFSGPATLRFWKKMSQLSFPSGLSVSMQIDGQTGFSGMLSVYWMEEVIDFGAGPHLVRWVVRSAAGSSPTNHLIMDQVRVEPPRPLQFIYHPQDQTIDSGENLFLSATAVGTPPIYYHWRKDGVDVPGQTNYWLEIASATTNDSGTYILAATNSQGGIISSNATITVLPPAAPSFVSEPADVSGYAGSWFQWSGSVEGSPPFVSWWVKDEAPVPGSLATNLAHGYFLTLTLTNLAFDDAGGYRLVVTNALGKVESSNAVLVVLPTVEPSILRHPRSLEVAQGVNTWLSLGVTGAPNPYVTWFRGGQTNPPTPPGPLPPPVGGYNSGKLLNNIQPTDAGVYFATATNLAGSVTSREALVRVLPPVSPIGSWSQGAEDVVVTNGLAFLARGTAGLTILSVSNPAAPVLLGGFDTPGFAEGVCVADGLAFIADGGSGLRILSITNPFAPIFVGAYDTAGYASDISVRSNLAFLGDGTGGLVILNVTNPASPALVGKYSTNVRAMKVCLFRDNALVASPVNDILPGTNVAGTVIVDISNPSQPVEVGRLGMGMYALDVRGSLVFGATGSGLRILDLTNPTDPVDVGNFSTYGGRFRIPVNDVQVVHDLVFLVGHDAGSTDFYVLDAANPAEPIPVGYRSLAVPGDVLRVDGNRVYLENWDGPLNILEIPFDTQPPQPPTVGLIHAAELQLRVQGKIGRHYEVQHASSLAGSNWQVWTELFLTNSSQHLEIQPTGAARFFRLRQLE